MVGDIKHRLITLGIKKYLSRNYKISKILVKLQKCSIHPCFEISSNFFNLSMQFRISVLFLNILLLLTSVDYLLALYGRMLGSNLEVLQSELISSRHCATYSYISLTNKITINVSVVYTALLFRTI
jgi:hypothetical protein